MSSTAVATASHTTDSADREVVSTPAARRRASRSMRLDMGPASRAVSTPTTTKVRTSRRLRESSSASTTTVTAPTVQERNSPVPRASSQLGRSLSHS